MRNRPLKRIGAGFGVVCAMLTSAVHAASPSQPAVIEIASDNSVATVFACFSRKASFPSFAHLSERGQDGSAVYSLRFDREMLEQVRIRPVSGHGSRIEVFLSGQYANRDVRAFKTHRGDVLAECARPQPPVLARMMQQVQP